MRRKAILGAVCGTVPALMLLLLFSYSAASAAPTRTGSVKTTPQGQPAESKSDPASESESSASDACGVTYSAWSNLPDLPAVRNQAMSAAINDKLYVMGGYNTSYSEAANLYRLNTSSPASGWTTLASMPTRAYGTQAVAIGHQIFVPGGYGTDGPIDTMQIYEAGENTWSQGAALPTPLGGTAAVAYNGRVYMFGGAGANNEPASSVYVYDPVTNGYAQKSDMPGPTYNAAAVVHNNRIYVIGGSGYYYAHYVYSPDRDQWFAIAPSPRNELDRNGLLSFGGEIWVFGGSYGGTVAPGQAVQIYTPYTNSWRYGPAYNNARVNTSAVALVGSSAYVAGGLSEGNASAKVESISYSGTPCQPSCSVSYPDVPPGSPFYPDCNVP